MMAAMSAVYHVYIQRLDLPEVLLIAPRTRRQVDELLAHGWVVRLVILKHRRLTAWKEAHS
jgi:hypothetical protein